MITVAKVLDSSKDTQKVITEQNEEVLKTGKIEAVTRGYGIYIFIGLVAVGFGYWLWKNGKEQNGTISG